ncbi:MAG: ectoine/hydroxyectoine ABC transporter substrate-binding protein EhuB [Streptosporangiales bacterium]|nr:ectoine/hydroxyectoine ABC transporter substrate-binding protein EhuB [Streptosporangiales bacterium]
MTDAPWTRRDFVRRAGATSTVLLGGPALFFACGDDSGSGNGDGASDGGGALDRIRRAGVVSVGFADEVPYSFKDANGDLTGQAPTVAGAVFSELGIAELEGVQVGWDSLIPSLDAGQFDVIAAGMFIKAERCEAVAFSNPDYCGTTAFAVAEGNPFSVSTYDDVAANGDIRLGVLRESVEVFYAREAGVPDGQVTAFPTITALFRGLVDDGVDAISLTRTGLNWTYRHAYVDAPIEVTEGFVPVLDGEKAQGCGGYAFRREDADLVEEFNEGLRRLQDSGRLLKLLEPFGFSAEEIEMAKEHTADELCSA